jgi:hypothetical protein
VTTPIGIASASGVGRSDRSDEAGISTGGA